MVIYFLTLIYLSLTKLMVDTETQISGILFFNNQQQEIVVWIRPQPSFDINIKVDLPIIFAVVNDKNGSILLKYQYSYSAVDKKIMIFQQDQVETIYLVGIECSNLFDVTWMRFIIGKSSEIIEYIIFNKKYPLQNMKLNQPNMIYSWQSKLFSCNIYDQQDEQKDSLMEKFAILQNDVFINQVYLRNFNSRYLTIFLIYVKFQPVKQKLVFIQIQDQHWGTEVIFDQTNIYIDFYYGYYKSFSPHFDSNITNQWILVSLFINAGLIKFQLEFKEQFQEQSIPYKYSYEDFLDSDHQLFEPINITINRYIENYKTYVINKFVNTQIVELEKFCFQNCKICYKLKCLECEGQLSLANNCQCPSNQVLHPTLGICIDKMLTQNIKVNNNFTIKFCPYGQYYDQQNLFCKECPKLNEFYCTPCLYNDGSWYSQMQFCDFYDILQQQLIQPEVTAQLFGFQTQPLINLFYPEDNRPLFYMKYSQRMVIFSIDIYRIFYELCEQHYFYDIKLKKCKILSKGKQFDFSLDEKQQIICKIGFIFQKNKCIKCQNNCLFCKFYNYKLICIMPKQSYALGLNQLVIKCQDSKCQLINKQVYDECQIENCMVCYYASCLLCNHSYIHDYESTCHVGKRYSILYGIEVNENFIKPQFYYQQILYLRYQLETLKISLTYDDIIQLMIFGNNLKAMKQDQLPYQANNIYSKYNQQVYCLNQTQYQGKKFCHQLVSGYQYIKQLNKYVYCYDQNCQFDLIFQVIILFTNQPSIQYKNMTFQNFDFFTQSLSIDDLFIKNIIIEAQVYVFDSFQNNCYHSSAFFFNITNKNLYNYQVILDFQGVSVFANCYNQLTIEFHEVQIVNLITFSSVLMQFNSDKVSIKNCTFLNQENMLFYIEAQFIQLEQIYIQGILKAQDKPIINFHHPVQIENVLIVDLYIGNVSLYQSALINTCSKVLQAKIESISIKYVQFREKSTFVRAGETINLRIDFLIVDNLFFLKSGLILLLEQLPNDLTINNLIVQNSSFEPSSLLIQSYKLNLVNASFIDLNFESCFLFFVKENLTMQNLIFQNLELVSTYIIRNTVKLISIYQFSIMSSLIKWSNSLIEISTTNFSLRYIYLKNCFYTPNIKLININGGVGIISSLMINNITNTTDESQVNYENNQFLDMIVIQADKILIQRFYFVDLFHPQPFLYVKYNHLQIKRIYLRNIYFAKKFEQELNSIIKYMIQLQANKTYNTMCFIQNFKATQIFIENYSNSHLYNLTLLNMFRGQVNINQLIINNLQSNIQIYILNAYQLTMRIQNIQLHDIENVGLLYFSSSNINCIDVFYNTTYLYTIRVPLLKNDQLLSQNNIIKLQDLELHNLSYSLIDIKTNFSLQILIINLKLKNILLQDDLIKIQQSISGLGFVSISQIQIIDQISDNQQQYYFLSENNLIVYIQFLQMRNVNMGVYKSLKNQHFYGNNLWIFNGTINQSLFSFTNYSGEISIQNMIINSLTLHDNTIINLNLAIYSSMHNIIFDTVTLIQYNGESFIDYVQNLQKEALFSLKDISIYQSQFNNEIFHFKSQYPIKFDIQGLQINKVNCGTFFLTKFNNILIKKSVIIDLYERETWGTQEIQFIFSYLYQTNILYNEIDANHDNGQNKSLPIYDLYPIQLSFHGNQSFKIILNMNNIPQIQYSQDNNIAYVPSGQQLKSFQYFNLKTQVHEQIYKQFSIKINSRELTQNKLIKCNLKQSIDGMLVGQYSNFQEFYVKNGLNTFDDFVFIMNPYQNYSFLQNDIICNNYTLRFDVRMLPCQLGEYLFQNKCITCDINKNLYSIIQRAQHCKILNPEQILEIKIGKIKLNQNYWRPSMMSNQIEKCESDQVCRGGWLNGDKSCHLSRVGAVCKECDIYNLKGEGQFVQSGQKCLECQPNLFLLLKGFFIFLWIILVTYLNYNRSKKITEKFLQFKIINKIYSDLLMRQSIDQFSIIIKIYTNYIFIIYLVQENLQFLDNNLLIALNFISNPGLIITTELDCILVKIVNLDIQYIQLASSLISPIIILMIAFFIYTILLTLKLQRYSFNLIIIITYSIYLFNQQIIIQNQIKLLSYKIISGIKWIYSNQQFQFYTLKHIQMIIFFIAPTTSLLLIIPTLLFFLLKYKDKRSILCIKKYGIIYCDFKQKAYFWEIIRIYTKHIIIFLLYFLNYVDQSIVLFFLLLKIQLHIYIQPYPLKIINQVERNAYVLTVLSLILIFQLIKKIPILTFTVLIILNVFFAYKIILLLIRCFKRQYSNLIQTIIKLLKQKFPNRFQHINLQDNRLILQKFRRATKKILNKTSKHLTYLMPIEKGNLITINAEIELQPLQNNRPSLEQILRE